MRARFAWAVWVSITLAGCGGGEDAVDGGTVDATARDGGFDASTPDAGPDNPVDAGSVDGGPGHDAAAPSDAALPDAASPADAGPSDAAVGVDAGGSGGPCSTDADCPAGSEWCEGGRCVACDNSGLACRIACRDGWSVYERNGCHPCECAPINDCTADADCAGSDGAPQRCYAGAFCWDWCPAGDPSCCFGNLCDRDGCSAPHPVGCVQRGCPQGQTCDTESGIGCEPSGCGCGGSGFWMCTADCGGGVCVP